MQQISPFPEKSSTALAVIGATKVYQRSLAELGDRIEHEHLEVQACVMRGLKHAVEAGWLCFEAKQVVGHGEWEQWLLLFAKQHRISVRSLRVYMQLAKAVDQGKLQICSDAADLSVRAALALIAKPKDATTTAPDHHPTPVTQDRDTCALGELGQLEACWTQFLTLLDAVERVVRLRFLKNTAASSPWHEVAP
jgi:hypothetical protein